MSIFRFRQFTIQQDRTPMKVGTDGVLLGAWADVAGARHILDIGTGTGLIALMCAQRNPTARISALEIEPNACNQARENISASPWAGRIEIIQTALQNYISGIQFDSIICNPPFFKASTKAPDQGRSLARHNDSLPLVELVKHSVRLLAPEGKICVILPVAEGGEMIGYAKSCQLYPAHICRVLPTPGKPAKRLLIKFTFTVTSLKEDEMVIELSRHNYSATYKELTQEFYL